DILDHLEFGLAEILDQLASLGRRCMPVAGGLDQLAALLGILAQRNESLHAGILGTTRLWRRTRRRALELRSGDGRNTSARERRRVRGRRAEGCGGRAAIYWWKRRSVARGRGGLIGQRRGKCALGAGLSGTGGNDGQR